MAELTFVADENVDRAVIARMRELGFVVRSIAELEPSCTDEEVLMFASSSQAVLITADKDFGELVYRQQRASAGVMLSRLAGLRPAEKAMVVLNVVAEQRTELVRAFTVVSAAGVRIRRRMQ